MHENMNIDLVYTWVDGSDSEWNEQRLKYQNQSLDEASNNECRYNDFGQLKFSLRSVDKYAAWIHHIYLVTSGQVPAWLDTNNHKITLIKHEDIMPKLALPTFNSNAIEHCLCNIPNLSEYFLYSNDDTFFGDYVTPSFFYSKSKKPIVRYMDKISGLKDGIYKTNLLNSVNCLKRKKYKCPENKPHHNIDAYLKSEIIACQEIFKHEIEKTIYNRFRDYNDIQRYIYSLYLLATGHGIGKKRYLYDRNKPLYKKIYKYILRGTANDSLNLCCTDEDIDKILVNFQPKLFCINDSIKVTKSDREKVIKILETLFPEKSCFEK